MLLQLPGVPVLAGGEPDPGAVAAAAVVRHTEAGAALPGQPGQTAPQRRVSCDHLRQPGTHCGEGRGGAGRGGGERVLPRLGGRGCVGVIAPLARPQVSSGQLAGRP